MGITRRDFVKLVVGGVAGLQVTPLPWKLTDDIAIWTQNWPWVPVPATGAFSQEKSVCTLCPGGCGIEVRKVDDRAVKIEGRTDFPINPGGICPVGMGGLQLLYDKDIRFTSPMKRVGPRGSGDYIPISWNEAITTLASRIKELRLKGKPELLAAIDGNRKGSTLSELISRLLNAIGSPNYMRQCSAEDTYWMLNAIMQGNEGPIAFDLENSNFVLSFGCGLLEGWGAPGRTLNAWGMWHEQDKKGKVTIVQIDSRASNTASKAHQWIAVRPGTEAAFALSLAHVIIRENLYNREFVEKHSFGFNDWTSGGTRHMGFKTLVMEKYSPSQVAKLSGVEPGTIEKLARAFAKARAPIAIFGRGKASLNGSLYEFMAVHSLNALVGNINMPGGVLVYDKLPLKDLPDFEPDPIAESGLAKSRIDQADSKQYPFTEAVLSNFANAILRASTPPIDTLLVFGANPAFTEPDGGLIGRALKKIPFIVSFSPFRDETALMADLILPDHTCLEKMEEVLWPPTLQYPFYGLSKPVVRPVFKTKNVGDTLLELARALEEPVASAFPWKSYEDILKERARGLFDSGGGLVSYEPQRPAWLLLKKGSLPKPQYSNFDEMWDAMKASGMWYRPSHEFKNWTKLFRTPNYKFEFYSTQIQVAIEEYTRTAKDPNRVLKDMAIKATGDEVLLPHQEVPVLPGENPRYPLVMVPYDLINLSSSWVPSPPFLSKTWFDNQLLKKDSFVELNPATAKRYGLREGDKVLVETPSGKARARVTIFEGAMPEYIFMPQGFGHLAYDEFLKGKGINPNHLVAGTKDAITGLPVWWTTPARITKLA